MDISIPTSSPSGTRFMPFSPPPQSELAIEAFPEPLEQEYNIYLEKSNNRSVLTDLKRDTMRWHLNNRTAKPRGETIIERQADSNSKHYALSYFELQDQQIYRKAELLRGTQLGPRYAACTWDSFRIICKTHRALQHSGKSI